MIALASIAVLSGILPTALITTVQASPRSDAWPFTIAIMIWSGIRLSLVWVKGEARLFDFFFWLFSYIFMGLAASVQILTGLVASTTPSMDHQLDIPTALIVILGLICYEAGRGLAIVWERARAGEHRAPDRATQVGTTRTVLLVVISLAASAYFIARVGIGAALGSREAAAAARTAVWPDTAMRAVFFALAIYPMLVSVGCLSQIRRRQVSRLLRTVVTVGMLACVCVLLLIVNPIASARYTFGTVLFALAAYAGAIATQERARITMLATILGFLFVFPVADAFRRDTVRYSRDSFFGEYMLNGDYDAFWQTANAVDFWLSGYVVPLQQLTGNLLFWMPRAIWPDKPIDTGSLLAQFRGYTFENLSAPMWAEFLVNGGIVALVIGFIVLGAVLRRFDTKLIQALAGGGVWAIVGAVFPVYMTILMRGSWLQATGAMAVAIACLILVADRREGPVVVADHPSHLRSHVT